MDRDMQSTTSTTTNTTNATSAINKDDRAHSELEPAAKRTRVDYDSSGDLSTLRQRLGERNWNAIEEQATVATIARLKKVGVEYDPTIEAHVSMKTEETILRAKNEALTAEKEASTTKIKALTAEKEASTTKIKALTAEKEAVSIRVLFANGLPLWIDGQASFKRPSTSTASDRSAFNVRPMEIELPLYRVDDLPDEELGKPSVVLQTKNRLEAPTSEASLLPYVLNLLGDLKSVFGINSTHVRIECEQELARARPDILLLRLADNRPIGVVEMKKYAVDPMKSSLERGSVRDQYARYLLWLVSMGVRNPFLLMTDYSRWYAVTLHDFSDQQPPSLEEVNTKCIGATREIGSTMTSTKTTSPTSTSNTLNMATSGHSRPKPDWGSQALQSTIVLRPADNVDSVAAANVLSALDEDGGGRKLTVFRTKTYDTSVAADKTNLVLMVTTAVAHMLVAHVKVANAWQSGQIPCILRTLTSTQTWYEGIRVDVTVSTGVTGENNQLDEATRECIESDKATFYVLSEAGRGATGICTTVLVVNEGAKAEANKAKLTGLHAYLRALKRIDMHSQVKDSMLVKEAIVDASHEAATREVEMWKALYNDRFEVFKVTADRYGAVLMPYFTQLSDEDRTDAAMLGKIEAMLRKVADNRLKHTDIHWHHVAKYQDEQQDWQPVLIDLESVKEMGEDEDDSWVDEWLTALKERVN